MKITNQEILKFMRESVYRPLTMKELIKNFNISSENRNSFRTLIRGLASDGEIIKIKGNRFGLPEKMNLVTGVVQGHPDGYGFVIPEDGGEDLFINPRNMREVMHGDKVICRAESAQKGGKKEGRIIRILERGHKTIVGIYEPSGHFGFVIPDDRRISHDIYIPLKYSGKAKRGHAVITEITAYPMKNRNPEGRIIELIGYPDNPDVEIDIVLRKYDVPSKFPIDVLKEADAVQKEVTDEEIIGRLDLRDKNIVTIDGEKAKDFDDAVYVERLNNGNYMLGVHIAYVSHYVKEENNLDNEAFKRGTSVYFPDRVIPMLPFQLSNEICSLKPKVNRLTLSAFMEFDRQGELINYSFAESVINSKERMTYTDVAVILEKGQGENKDLKERYSYLLNDFYLMRELCEVLRERRMRKGSIDFDLPEPDIILDLMGKPENIIKTERNIAHKIIEEFMLVANETVATHFTKLEIPALYRVHDEPDPAKIIELSEFVSNFGYHLKIPRPIHLMGVPPPLKKEGKGGFHPKRFQELLNSIRGKPEELLISTITLRHMKQARYSPENIGHFGLAFENYTHFTSPIRRYPDLIVHRLLKDIAPIHKGGSKGGKKRLDMWEEKLPEIARHSSERERTSDEAENDIVKLKRVQFMMEKIGGEYEGIISGVTAFGLFVELSEIFVEGLVHVSGMTDDYYALNERDHSLIGRRTKKRFRMGDRVKVKVENVSIEKRQIDFKLVK